MKLKEIEKQAKVVLSKLTKNKIVTAQNVIGYQCDVTTRNKEERPVLVLITKLKIKEIPNEMDGVIIKQEIKPMLEKLLKR